MQRDVVWRPHRPTPGVSGGGGFRPGGRLGRIADGGMVVIASCCAGAGLQSRRGRLREPGTWLLRCARRRGRNPWAKGSKPVNRVEGRPLPARKTRRSEIMANVPGAYCPFRVSAIAGALSPCNDECALYIPTSKMPAQKSCAISILGVYALQRIVFKQQEPGKESARGTEGGDGEST